MCAAYGLGQARKTFAGPPGDSKNNSRAISSGNAAIRITPTIRRSPTDASRPVGNDNKMTAKTKYHRLRNTPPSVKTSGEVACAMRNVPAQTIANAVKSAPIGLQERRAQTKAPLTPNEAATNTYSTDVASTLSNPCRATIGASISAVVTMAKPDTQSRNRLPYTLTRAAPPCERASPPTRFEAGSALPGAAA